MNNDIVHIMEFVIDFSIQEVWSNNIWFLHEIKLIKALLKLINIKYFYIIL